MDKYTVKMFPQAYRDLNQIYEQIALNSNYDSSAMDIIGNNRYGNYYTYTNGTVCYSIVHYY